MSEPPARRKLRIENGADLFEALRSPELATRVSVLGAIAQYPQRAAEYAKAFDPDLVTWLLHEASIVPDGYLRSAVLTALFAFDDDRICGFIQNEFLRATRADYLLSLVPRLQREPPSRVYPLFHRFLQEGSPAHAHAAAVALAACDELTPTERIRVATRARPAWSPPLLDAATEAVWLDELAGTYEASTREMLRAQGRAAFVHLAACASRLSRLHRTWLLHWAADDGGEEAVEMLRHALEGHDVEAMLIALAHAARFPLLAPSVAPLEAHPDAAVQAAAIAAGAGTAEACRARVEDPAVPRPVRIVCLQRLQAAPSPTHHAALVQALRDPHWQVRSAAASALVAQGEGVLALVDPLLADADVAVRMAAVQIFVAFGRESWLEEKLLS